MQSIIVLFILRGLPIALCFENLRLVEFIIKMVIININSDYFIKMLTKSIHYYLISCEISDLYFENGSLVLLKNKIITKSKVLKRQLHNLCVII
jgi:hypothetical protein